eukprot:CAMPEP_0198137846 /NCGR_PEP_ID=MMETSP1443-20131203/1303_1 /TAXON_ID=186043 /ORGANISM="Entomoneis sp., Strain CCMP2396" /LENGTH=62 /DNA_ID=CAMNT_0043799407 /DNA_START=69 /DNA_END=257 /DNA_ORIENTATION=-
MGKPKKTAVEEEFKLNKKDQKKVDKLTAQIPFHDSRGNKEDVLKINEQIASITLKARQAAGL